MESLEQLNQIEKELNSYDYNEIDIETLKTAILKIINIIKNKIYN